MILESWAYETSADVFFCAGFAAGGLARRPWSITRFREVLDAASFQLACVGRHDSISKEYDSFHVIHNVFRC